MKKNFPTPLYKYLILIVANFTFKVGTGLALYKNLIILDKIKSPYKIRT